MQMYVTIYVGKTGTNPDRPVIPNHPITLNEDGDLPKALDPLWRTVWAAYPRGDYEYRIAIRNSPYID